MQVSEPGAVGGLASMPSRAARRGPTPADAAGATGMAARDASANTGETTSVAGAGAEAGSSPPTPKAKAKAATGRHQRRSNCPVACSLDLLGDRWSLLIIRDLLLGKSRYTDFLTSTEAIPTNILAERLKRLAQAGIISTATYSNHPRRKSYALTPAGQALAPAVRALRDWGLSQFAGTRAAD